MAGAAILVARILLVLMADRLILICGKPGVLRVLLRGCRAVQVRFALLRNGAMVAAAHRLHDH